MDTINYIECRVLVKCVLEVLVMGPLKTSNGRYSSANCCGKSIKVGDAMESDEVMIEDKNAVRNSVSVSKVHEKGKKVPCCFCLFW